MTLLATTAIATVALTVQPATAASHREAPRIALDPTADNTDTYAFLSYDVDNLRRPAADRRVTFIMNVLPGQDPADGPNYFEFDDRVLYKFNIDNNQDGNAEDIVYEVAFQTETRPILGNLNFPLPYVGNPNIPIPQVQGIIALDGPGSEGLSRRQTYTVTEVRGANRTQLFQGRTLIAVPSNVGPATMPSYEALAAQGIYRDDSNGLRVFAGQRAETFYIDLGAVFDTVNLRRPVPALTPQEDQNTRVNPFGINRFSGTNVHTIAFEVPIRRLTADGLPANTSAFPVIGMYASTNRQPGGGSGDFVQVSRLANPLVNELIIDTPTKDQWNGEEPEDEAQFQEFYKNPSLATAFNLIFGLPVPATPRTDLMQTFLKYPGQTVNGLDCGTPCSELLRLDLRVKPRAASQQERLGGLAGDPAGFPNGRRPNDDVTDIAIRVVGGQVFIDNRVGDGVNILADAPGAGTLDGPGYGTVPGNRLDVLANGIAREFPFMPTPSDGRNRQHRDCDEPGENPCN
jgi:hypothetical protein